MADYFRRPYWHVTPPNTGKGIRLLTLILVKEELSVKESHEPLEHRALVFADSNLTRIKPTARTAAAALSAFEFIAPVKGTGEGCISFVPFDDPVIIALAAPVA